MLDCRTIKFSYQEKAILKGLQFSLPKTGLVGILGHNGSGKSTLLKILSGLLPCQEGSIHLDGENILDAQRRLKKSTRSITGVLLQESSSDEKLSVLDNLIFFARLMNVEKKFLHDRVQKNLRDANLLDEAFIILKKLSGGTRRRCELYRTFLHKPRFLLLDEPTGALDFHESARFFSFARNYVDEERALLLFSSHNADDFLACDQVVMMHQGRIIAQGPPQRLLEEQRDSHVEVELHQELAPAWLFRAGGLFSEAQSQKFSAWLSKEKLEQCLSSHWLNDPAIKSFSMRAADLADVYERQLGQS